MSAKGTLVVAMYSDKLKLGTILTKLFVEKIGTDIKKKKKNTKLNITLEGMQHRNVTGEKNLRL